MSTEPTVTTASRYTGRRTIRNGALSAAQVVTVGATLLLAYRLALTEVSREEFGLYATMFACGTLTQLGTLGFAGGAARHMARAVGEDDRSGRLQVALSSLGVALAGSLVVSAVLLAGLLWYGSTLSGDLSRAAGDLAPVVVAAALVTPLSTAAQGLTDGLGQTHVRSLVVIGASLVFYGVVAVVLPAHGVVSLAWAALVQQGLVVLVLTGVVLRDCDLSPASIAWNRATWRRMTAYNLKFQVMTVPALALEPLAKLLLGAYAGFSAVATYEIANRLLQQVNAVVLAAIQAVVPLVAFRAASGSLADDSVFRRLFQAAWALSLTAFAAALVAVVPLGAFVFGESDAALAAYAVVLCVGWLANALAAPAYFISVTTDSFGPNVVASYLMIAIPGIVGVLLGEAFGGIGIAIAVSLGLLVACCVVTLSFMRRRQLTWDGVLGRPDAAYAALLCAPVAAVLVMTPRVGAGTAALLAVAALAAVAGLGAVYVRRGPVWSIVRRREA